jgi:hypothetical protein
MLKFDGQPAFSRNPGTRGLYHGAPDVFAALTIAAINAAAFHAGVFRSAAKWDCDVDLPVGAKLHAVAYLALWIAIIACGRLIAYV